ncbi:hypothetical protein [Modestobacter versicolor]|uniref:hypothetical protein n=1 Tax=Modestobacter versicolor TaxID=429133 RepID=UPI0034DE0C4B
MASTRVGSRPPPVRPTRPAVRSKGRRRRPSVRRFVPLVVVVLLAALVAVLWDRREELIPPMASQCSIPGSDVELTTEQAANAATIAAVARSRGLPARATVVALATAQQESRLRNLDYGDRDSLGLFQQRPSQDWGTPEQVRDPVYAAGKFFDRLVEVPGWETGRLTEVAQAVQRSGFPEAYQQWEPLGTALAGALLATTPDALRCGFPPPTTSGPAAQRTGAVAEVVRREAGAPTVEDGTVSVAGAGWPEATWAVAHAERLQLDRVVMDGWRWTPSTGWEQTPSAFALPLQLRLA